MRPLPARIPGVSHVKTGGPVTIMFDFWVDF